MGSVVPMSLDHWMADARLDAERRGLPALVPLLESLRLVLARLRAADWNDELSGRATIHPGAAARTATAGGKADPRAASAQ